MSPHLNGAEYETGTGTYKATLPFPFSDLKLPILTQKPWEFRSNSPERGQISDNIAKVLNLLDGFMVYQRSIHDRYKTLATKHKQKTAAEEKVSGVSPEHTGFGDAIEETAELFNESDLEREEKNKNIEEEGKGIKATVT